MNDSDTTVAELKALIGDFVAARQWQKYHRPKNLAMSIAIEAAELMEHFQWEGEGEAEKLASEAETRDEVAAEMADVLAYLLSLANATGIDLAASFQQKMRRNEIKYPADAMIGQYRRPKKTRG
ncbi:MAG: nucleotide pyrophosphohydrolase [Planctomycetota bacterium]